MEIIGALFIGILCGIVPYKLGKKMGEEGWGLGGFISCVIGGLFLGMILAIPFAAIFSAIILVSKKSNNSSVK